MKNIILTKQHLIAIAKKPHLIGKIAGKDKLTDQHSDWIKYIWNTTTSKALQAHRGSYKTTAIATIGTIVWLLFHPNDRICIIRKTFTDASEIVRSISLIMQMAPIMELFRLAHGFYPIATMNREGKLLFNFKASVTPESSVEAHGLDYGMTGSHYDRIIMDDFVTLRDRVSKAEREKSKEVLREVMANIIDPGQPVSYIGTPWHKSDAWTLCPDPIKFDVYKAGILSPREIEEKKLVTTPVLFAANYLLEHQSDDMALFRDPVMKPWDYGFKKAIAQLDAAFDGDHYCALTIIARTTDGKKQAVGFTSPGNVKDWAGFIAAKCKKYFVDYIYNETNPDKGFTADLLKQHGLKVREYMEKTNKHHKISTHLYQHWNTLEWSPDTDDEYLEQVLDYREGQEPDDAPDSAASLLREAFNEQGEDQSALWGD